jgi:putative addiction module component (TIGR02574 family)
MSTQAERILQSARRLSPDNRLEIAEVLLISVDEVRGPEIVEAWAEEIRRRIDSIDNGEVELIPWENVLREMRERLNG